MKKVNKNKREEWEENRENKQKKREEWEKEELT